MGLPKNQISACIKDPSQLPDSPTKVKVPTAGNKETSILVSRPRLCADVYRCFDNDPVSSPYVEAIRRVTGLE